MGSLMTRPTHAELQAIKRGTVVLVDLDPAQGFEQAKRRPCAVVSADIYNKKLATIIVVPISGLEDENGRKRASLPHEVEIPAGSGGLRFKSAAQPVQIRTLDRHARVTKILGELPENVMTLISMKITEVTSGL